MTSILEGVATRGSAPGCGAMKNTWPAKPETTNDSKEGWFVGFSPDLVVGTYIGFDEPRTLGRWETGASVALPVFYAFYGRGAERSARYSVPHSRGHQTGADQLQNGKPAVPGDQVVITEALKPDFDFETAGSVSLTAVPTTTMTEKTTATISNVSAIPPTVKTSSSEPSISQLFNLLKGKTCRQKY